MYSFVRKDNIMNREEYEFEAERERRRYSREQRRLFEKKKKQQKIILLIMIALVVLLIGIVIFMMIKSGKKDDDTFSDNLKKVSPTDTASGNNEKDSTPTPTDLPSPTPTPNYLTIKNDYTTLDEQDFIKIDLLTPNRWSRGGEKLETVKHIVVHYVGNPNTTAANNRNFFENLKTTHEASRSAHFIVGIEGEVLQIIPLNEWSYASNQQNVDSINIEVCHPDASGKFTEKTYDSLTHLINVLLDIYHLPEENIIRHYDVTGKICPKYYVEHEDEWLQLKKDAINYVK